MPHVGYVQFLSTAAILRIAISAYTLLIYGTGTCPRNFQEARNEEMSYLWTNQAPIIHILQDSMLQSLRHSPKSAASYYSDVQTNTDDSLRSPSSDISSSGAKSMIKCRVCGILLRGRCNALCHDQAPIGRCTIVYSDRGCSCCGSCYDCTKISSRQRIPPPVSYFISERA